MAYDSTASALGYSVHIPKETVIVHPIAGAYMLHTSSL